MHTSERGHQEHLPIACATLGPAHQRRKKGPESPARGIRAFNWRAQSAPVKETAHSILPNPRQH
jgi:hypothetical protein